MKLAIISDLHLGPPPTNRCTATTAQLLGLFDEIEGSCDRVIVAGDLFDLSRPRRPGGWLDHLARIEQAHPRVFARLATFDWIYGNHDVQLARLGVAPRLVIEADGLRILIQHGHQFDGGIKRLAGLPEAANYAAGWLHRSGLRSASRLLGDVPVGIDRALAILGVGRTPDPNEQRSQPVDRALAGARRLLSEEGWDLVVMGHSHELRIVPQAGGLFVNTGALCEGHLDYAVIDTTAGVVSTVRDAQVLSSHRPPRPT